MKNQIMYTYRLFIVVVSILTISTAWGTTYYVSPDGTDDANGTDWTTAFKTIQKGIDTAIEGDIVEVNEGTYYESIVFDGNNITLTSIDPCDWDVVEATIIDGNEALRAVRFSSGEDSNSVLTGFTIQNSLTHTGIFCHGLCSPTISKCIVKGNHTGIYAYAAAPVILNNEIADNLYNGILVLGAQPLTIKNNCIYGSNAGIRFSSGSSDTVIRNNTITSNITSGITVAAGSSPSISNCIIWDSNDDLYNCSAKYSCIEEGFDSNDPNFTGSISSDPYFIDANTNDFHIDPNSPCIDTGDPNGTYAGEFDIDLEIRVIDGDGDSNSIVDMGADEYDPNS